MPFELFVALRYLIGRRKGLFTFTTTGIAIGGITLGVAALIITLAVMSGFHFEIQKRILGIQTHLVVGSYSSDFATFDNFSYFSSQLKKLPEIQAIAPFVHGQVILRHGHQTSGALIKGIVYENERQACEIDKFIRSGNWKDIKENGIVLGKVLARTLNADIGNKIILISPPADMSSTANTFISIPKMKELFVRGIFDSGMYEYDANLAYLVIDTAQNVFGLNNKITGLGIKTTKFNKTEKLVKKVQAIVGKNYWVQSWQTLNRSLFSALKLEKIMMFIILTLIVLVASFNIVSNLLLFTVEKAKDIGILSAIGATKKNIHRIFLIEGLLMGFIGIFFGVGFGVIISIFLNKYHIIKLPSDVYYLDTLPAQLSISDIIIVIFAAFVIILVSTLYPAKKASKTDPLEAIRYG